MKKLPGLLALLILLAAGACRKGDGMLYASQYNASLQAFTAFKASAGNAYRFSVATYSWTNYSTSTTFTVVNDQITERSYKARGMSAASGIPVDTTLEQWDETGAQLGTHEDGAALQTLDQIYAETATNWLQKRAGVQTYFEANNSGMISVAGYWTNGCQDDCFTGILIENIVPLH